MNWNAILFDMDGVLIDSEELMRKTSMMSLAEHGVHAKDEDFMEFTGSDVSRKKPFPDIYLMGAEKVGEKPEDCLVVEDAISGVKAAHAAGMQAVAVPTSFSVEELREQAAPDYFLDEIKNLPQLLSTL